MDLQSRKFASIFKITEISSLAPSAPVMARGIFGRETRQKQHFVNLCVWYSFQFLLNFRSPIGTLSVWEALGATRGQMFLHARAVDLCWWSNVSDQWTKPVCSKLFSKTFLGVYGCFWTNSIPKIVRILKAIISFAHACGARNVCRYFWLAGAPNKARRE